MNERIKELAAKAYLSVNPGPDPYNEAEAAWAGFGPLERKFAELIVLECANLTLDYKTHDHYMGWVDHGEAIAQHFGVKR